MRKEKLGFQVAAGAIAALAGCAPAGTDAPADTPEPAAAPSELVEIEATDYAFTAPPTFPSGWVKLRFVNAAEETHFLLLWKLPEGRTFEDWTSSVARPFYRYYGEYRSGAIERQEMLEGIGGALPAWFAEATRAGGPGFTAPKRTSETWVQLEPGDYAMECYVRGAEEGHRFHGDLGMLRPLIVTEASTGATPPAADIEITLSNFEMTVEGDLSAGDHVVRAVVRDDPQGLVQHNVHLVRLDEDDEVEQVATWLDWVDGMLPPAPAEFLGGAGQLPPGGESYFPVRLEPGRYAWISEDWGRRGMRHEFRVE